MTATRLTSDQLAALREQAKRETSSFVDPAQMSRVESFTAGHSEWAAAIIGRPYWGMRSISSTELVLLDLAAQAEPEPPEPPRAPRPGEPGYEPSPQEKARQERAEAAEREWKTLQAELPVQTSVAFNYSRHTYELHVNGGDHIVTWDDLSVGRLRRTAGRALCETPSRSRSLHLDNQSLEREAQEEGREKALPTCKACLRIAYRLAGREPSTLLLSRR